jgi:hypothetical protein
VRVRVHRGECSFVYEYLHLYVFIGVSARASDVSQHLADRRMSANTLWTGSGNEGRLETRVCRRGVGCRLTKRKRMNRV